MLEKSRRNLRDLKNRRAQYVGLENAVILLNTDENNIFENRGSIAKRARTCTGTVSVFAISVICRRQRQHQHRLYHHSVEHLNINTLKYHRQLSPSIQLHLQISQYEYVLALFEDDDEFMHSRKQPSYRDRCLQDFRISRVLRWRSCLGLTVCSYCLGQRCYVSEVPENERQELFNKKLRQCACCFDFLSMFLGRSVHVVMSELTRCRDLIRFGSCNRLVW